MDPGLVGGGAANLVRGHREQVEKFNEKLKCCKRLVLVCVLKKFVSCCILLKSEVRLTFVESDAAGDAAAGSARVPSVAH